MIATREAAMSEASVVYKVHAGNLSDDNSGSYDDNVPFTEEQIDIVAQALADTRIDLQTKTQAMIATATSEIRERVAMIEGHLSALMTLLGGDSTRSFEASETIRKLKVGR
jgi:hypothetical protein